MRIIITAVLLKNSEKESGRRGRPRTPLRNVARPVPIVIMESVTTIGTIFSLAMAKPLMRPRSADVRRITKVPTIRLQPRVVIKYTPTTAEAAMTAGFEMSMPPITST